MQCALLLFRLLFPARVLHILRSRHRIVFMTSWSNCSLPHGGSCLQCLLYLSYLPLQWQIAQLPIRDGGLAVPSWIQTHLVARLSALSMLQHQPSPPLVVQAWIDAELPELSARLQTCMKVPVDSVTGQLCPLPNDASPRFLARRLRCFCHDYTISDLRTVLAHKHPILHWRWTRREGGALRQPLSCAFLQAVPVQPELCLANDCLRGLLREILAIPDAAYGTQCHSLLTSAGRSCHSTLDVWGHHDMVCSHAEVIRRHNTIRNVIQHICKSVGSQAHIEQPTTTEALASEPSDLPGRECMHLTSMSLTWTAISIG